MPARYALDPRWLKARFPSTCSCGVAIRKGDAIFYYPNGRKALCQQCGGPAAAAFAAAAQDEAFLCGQNEAANESNNY